MASLIITEKSSQARDLRAALGDRYGPILPAEGHLLRLAEPDEINAAWKQWSPILLKPDGLYPTRPATDGNKPAKFRAIAAALKQCDQVILATDCDREGQLIGQEILEHVGYRGRVLRALFTAQDPKTLRQAFAQLRPNSELRPLYEAAVARQQADQIFNLSLTRSATKMLLAPGIRGVIGIGRVKTQPWASSASESLKSATSGQRTILRSSPPRLSARVASSCVMHPRPPAALPIAAMPRRSHKPLPAPGDRSA